MLLQNSIERILGPIASTQEGVGASLRYDPIYDQIRYARRFDDENLSQGVWKIDPKKSDWNLVEKLCTETLSSKSKDIQILGWLCESWVELYGLKGLRASLTLLMKFCQNYWNVFYPEVSDLEYRGRIFEWMEKALADRLLRVSISLPFPHLNITALRFSDWIDAKNLDQISRRSGKESEALVQNRISQGRITLAQFAKVFELCDHSFFQDLLEDLHQAKELLKKVRTTLIALCGSASPYFSKVYEYLNEIDQVISSVYQKKKPQDLALKDAVVEEISSGGEPAAHLQKDANPSPDVIVTGREEAYQALKDIGSFLKAIDPHSPSPYLIDLILEWRQKNLIQIAQDIHEGRTPIYQLLRLLTSTPPMLREVVTAKEPEVKTTPPQGAEYGGSIPPEILNMMKR